MIFEVVNHSTHYPSLFQNIKLVKEGDGDQETSNDSKQMLYKPLLSKSKLVKILLNE